MEYRLADRSNTDPYMYYPPFARTQRSSSRAKHNPRPGEAQRPRTADSQRARAADDDMLKRLGHLALPEPSPQQSVDLNKALPNRRNAIRRSMDGRSESPSSNALQTPQQAAKISPKDKIKGFFKTPKSSVDSDQKSIGSVANDLNASQLPTNTTDRKLSVIHVEAHQATISPTGAVTKLQSHAENLRLLGHKGSVTTVSTAVIGTTDHNGVWIQGDGISPAEMQTQLLSLQGALQDSTSELDRQLQQIRKLQREAEEREKAIQEIDQKLQASEEKRLEQDERLGRLRQKVSDAAASKSADAVPEQSHLRIPESEIIKLARELGYEVQNFVLNYLKDTSKSKMQTWAEIHAGRLKEITPYYNTYATDKKAMLRFVEAAIWAMLMRDVFMSSTTHGNVVWAGKYGKRLYRLSSSLAFTVQGDTTKERLFHQWKALTTGFLNKSTAQQLGRDDSIRDIVEGLEDLLEQLRPRHPISHGLQTIVEKAVALDEIFCGQHALYEFQYSEPRHDIYVDRKYMSVVEGSPQSNKVVRFSIRPYLSRAGGLRGESYSEFVCIENQLVWT